MMLLTALACLIFQSPSNPLDFGRAEIEQVAGAKASDVDVRVAPGRQKESFSIRTRDGHVTITGSDPVGAMYGAFEFAERLRNDGDKAWTENVDKSPFLPQRGVNLFLTIPWDYAKNDTDYDPQALIDPKRWWFQDDHCWNVLLDTMAHSRLNWLDIHGAWDISITDGPNLYGYFVDSPSFPLAGLSRDIQAVNLKQLNHVIEMAHARGIKVSLMSYQAQFREPENPNPPYKGTEANLYKYTTELVEAMIRRTPGLDAIGFRIGESGHGEEFFNSYLDAVKKSGRDIPIIARTWITKKQKVLGLARKTNDFTCEIKYNGEQWAAPYILAGGRMANWGSYSYEDYLSDSGNSHSSKMWQGNQTGDGGRWPSEPYKIVWQVRADGTHRIFPFYNPDWVRRTITTMKVGTAQGYTIEGEDAYYPKDPIYYLANPNDKYCDFVMQRDQMYWMTWGRLGYDPSTPDSTFDAVVKGWFGAQGQQIADIWKEASTIVPLGYLANSLGPDQRDDAPELETAGDEANWASGEPFDPLVFAAPNVFWDDGRLRNINSAFELLNRSRDVRFKLTPLRFDGMSAEAAGRFKELRYAASMLADLGDYFGLRLCAARSGYYDGGHVYGSKPAPVEGNADTPLAHAADAWKRLSHSPEADYYKPFTEKMRMHTNSFHWDELLASVEADTKNERPVGALTEVFRSPTPGYPNITRPVGNVVEKLTSFAKLHWTPAGSNIRCWITGAPVTDASLLYKPLPSSTFFHSVSMTKTADGVEVTIPRPRCGLCIAAELASQGQEFRIPSFLAGETPYEVVPAEQGPTPQIYATDEAMRFLNPSILQPDRFGTMIVAPRAARFFGFDKATKRKLLAGVKRGMKLLIMQQDFTAKRYSLDFLPKPLTAEANDRPARFDAGGEFGLRTVNFPGIAWQHFAPSDGWQLYGDGVLAKMSYGKGEIWVETGRLMQCDTDAGAANALTNLFHGFASSKPAILIDAGTESAYYTTSFYPDLLNHLGVPFLTLGEAIAQVQKMNSLTPIPGESQNDDVLGGKGAAMATTFLRNQVISASHRATPASVSAFEIERKRRKHELLRTLGLDPMPARTPLNAHITGSIKRDGYRIDKLVFESRPKFYVTCHVYVPDNATGKLPVIMNVNGHWSHKKDEDRIQLRCAFQALQGYIAIAVDSPGWSFEGKSLIERRDEGDHNDFKLVEGGSNATGYYVWDTMRALDYMATRPDTDMTRVGITGASGGGLATLYAFAADDRYKAAVPVVYMSSLELAPDNGCLCNHVPGTCQVGDRSDVIGIQAPKPVYIMGAQNDGEFTPPGMLLTHKKMAETWALFGKADDTYVQIYAGGHDYNQPMRESMIGFFNRYMKGVGDGSPVPQPPLTAIDPENHELLALDPPATDEHTMRDLSNQYLAAMPEHVSVADAIAVNGGIPEKSSLNWTETTTGRRRVITFESEAGLKTPAILFLPEGTPRGVRIVADDAGKSSAIGDREADALTSDGFAVLYVDVLGTGELSGVEQRYPTYMGRAIPFTGGWQLVRAAEGVKKLGPVELVGNGPIASQAVMWAGLQSANSFSKITGKHCLADWKAVFADSVPDAAVQPRAHLCGSLENLRKHVKHAEWH
jgi:dienelactone hydrolase